MPRTDNRLLLITAFTALGTNLNCNMSAEIVAKSPEVVPREEVEVGTQAFNRKISEL